MEKLEKSRLKIAVILTKEEFAEFKEESFRKLSEELEIRGFRKGKAPKEIAEKTLGEEKILAEAADLAVQRSYLKAVKDNKLEPISRPEAKIIKLDPESGLAFEAEFYNMPEVTLGDYKKKVSEVTKKKVKVDQKEIDGTLNWIKRSRAKFSAKESPAQKGDFVEIEYWSPDLPEISEENKKKDAFILGEGHFFPGFEEVITGLKSGDEKAVKLAIPKDHSYKKAAGRDLQFKIRINSVQKVEFPELDDSFARSLGNFENLDSLKQSIAKGLESEKEASAKNQARNQAMEKIAETAKVEIPPILIQREQENLFEQYKNNVSVQLGEDFGNYLKKISKTEEEIRKMILPEAEKKVKNYLILRQIGRQEGVSVSESEIDEEVSKTVKNYANPKEAEKNLGIDLESFRDYTKEAIRTEKTYKILDKLIS